MNFGYCRRFNLIEPKETEVLRDLEIALRLTDDDLASPPPGSSSSSSSGTTATSHLVAISNVFSPDSSAANSSNMEFISYEPQSQTTTTQVVDVIDGSSIHQPIVTQPECGKLCDVICEI